MGDVRLIVILNPGRVSRNWMVSLAAAAEGRGLLAGTLEIGDVWARINGAAPPSDHVCVRQKIGREIRALCERERVTHVLGYVTNGSFECGLFPGMDGKPASVWASAGVRHIMLWSDHPNWVDGAAALNDPLRTLLGHPMHTHLVKSEAAAAECRGVLGWANVHGLPVGEDAQMVRPARGVEPVHDAVVIMSDAAAPPERLMPMLGEDDPVPVEMMELMRGEALRRFGAVIAGADAALKEALARFGCAWADAKIASPDVSMWVCAQSIAIGHAEALAWLRSSPVRWYAAAGAMQQLTAWRRSFWPAWLGRRMDVGLYGSKSEVMGLRTPTGGDGWIEFARQGEVYARGRACLTINAGHDEEGMSHKAFQIAAAGGAGVHHATRGLDSCFAVGEEMLAFERGPELLDAVKRLSADPTLRRRMGDAARARFEREHTWGHRLERMLEIAAGDEADAGNEERRVRLTVG